MSHLLSQHKSPRQELFLLKDRNIRAASWDDMIALAKARIESLKAAIKAFEKYRDNGEPFSGQSQSQMPKSRSKKKAA